MKTTLRLCFFAFALLLSTAMFAQTATSTVTAPPVPPMPPAANEAVSTPIVAGKGILTFEEDVHEFGELMQGGDASYIFKFTNTGTEDIIISDAKPACGCTKPTFTTEPIKPGQTGEIPVKYDSNRLGGFDKWVSIISNASETEKKIYIKGNVLAKPVDPAVPPGVPATAPGSGH